MNRFTSAALVIGVLAIGVALTTINLKLTTLWDRLAVCSISDDL